MKRIRLNRGGLYPTGQPKKAGFKDTYFDHTCSGCGKIILKKESNITILSKGMVKKYHWGCRPGGKK